MRRKTLIVALAAAGLVGVGTAQSINLNPATTVTAPIASTTAPDYRAIFESYGPAVVGITVEGKARAAGQTLPEFGDDPRFRFHRGLPIPPIPRGESPAHGQGSGFIVSADGQILTNAHVVRDASTVTVKLADRREFEAKVLGVDPATDVAVLKIDATGLPVVQLGDAKKLAVGDYVLAIGSPFGFEQSATSGIVSAKRRSLPGDAYVPFIQTDVAVNPGNSGGPLFDARGLVVGINSQIYSRTGGYQGLSFAIPIDVAMRVRDQIVATGTVRHARLGVTVQDLNQDLAASFGLDLPNGALVSSVAPGSAAEKAGLRPGDVVLSLNGNPVERTGDLAAMIGPSEPGASVALEVMREGKRQTVTAVIAESPAAVASTDAEKTGDGSPGRLGVAVRPLAPEERRAANLQGGLVVEDVSGAAERAGIEPGDLILSVNGKSVATVDQLRAAVDGKDRRLALLVQRGETRIFVPVRIG